MELGNKNIEFTVKDAGIGIFENIKRKFKLKAFADEVFRVYQNQHPEKQITYINENKVVRLMIVRAKKQD